MTDRTHSEYHLSGRYGYHRGSSEVPSDPRTHSSWVVARDESQLDHIAVCPCICAEVLARADVGHVLQHYLVRRWDVRERTHQEEEAGSIAEEGM